VTGREEDGFLQRWSRRKQEAARRPALAPSPAPPDPAAAVRDETAEVERRAAEARERESILARLPKLEELTAESDFRLFMHPLVPAALRSAALARMWTLDPAIRDFVGPARDYAWDWNVPGGVPGGGPAPSLADVQAMLSRLTARLDAETAREQGREMGGETDAEPRDPAPETAASGEAAAPAEASPAAPQQTLPPGPVAMASPSEPVLAPPPYAEPSPVALRRRHGGATPV
jgi:hypothetical protein